MSEGQTPWSGNSINLEMKSEDMVEYIVHKIEKAVFESVLSSLVNSVLIYHSCQSLIDTYPVMQFNGFMHNRFSHDIANSR